MTLRKSHLCHRLERSIASTVPTRQAPLLPLSSTRVGRFNDGQQVHSWAVVGHGAGRWKICTGECGGGPTTRRLGQVDEDVDVFVITLHVLMLD